mmetsp:Transcript_128410/g.357454  ORF Transcript_128410/g.357454 Transcript_128410/m.357454 type:complete len:235 (+) Transcript_128410:458-1162(+)
MKVCSAACMNRSKLASPHAEQLMRSRLPIPTGPVIEPSASMKLEAWKTYMIHGYAWAATESGLTFIESSITATPRMIAETTIHEESMCIVCAFISLLVFARPTASLNVRLWSMGQSRLATLKVLQGWKNEQTKERMVKLFPPAWRQLAEFKASFLPLEAGSSSGLAPSSSSAPALHSSPPGRALWHGSSRIGCGCAAPCTAGARHGSPGSPTKSASPGTPTSATTSMSSTSFPS